MAQSFEVELTQSFIVTVPDNYDLRDELDLAKVLIFLDREDIQEDSDWNFSYQRLTTVSDILLDPFFTEQSEKTEISRIDNKTWQSVDGVLSGIPGIGDTIHLADSKVAVIVKGYGPPQTKEELATGKLEIRLLVTNKSLQGNTEQMTFRCKND